MSQAPDILSLPARMNLQGSVKNGEAGQSMIARPPHFEIVLALARLASLAGGVARVAILLALRLKLNLLVDFPRQARFVL